jgi:hypothetical protein
MKFSRSFTSVCSIAVMGVAFAGCKSSSSAPPPSTEPTAMAAPTTMPTAVMPNQGKLPEAPTAMAKPEAAKPDAASMTHMLTKDEPYFDGPPGADPKSAGTLKSGTKVLLMVPGATYSKVLTSDGETVYTVTDGLDPIPAKK